MRQQRILLLLILTALTFGLVPSPRQALSAFPGTNGKIAFHSFRDGNAEIYVMNGDGSGQTRLTSNAALDGWPAWSPDGSKITFTSDRDGNYEVYVMDGDGSGETNVTNNPVPDGDSAWSPDGSKIVFWSMPDPFSNGDIHVIDLDGSGLAPLTKDPDIDMQPDWSPDGTKIAFSRPHGVPPGLGITLINPDGTGMAGIPNSPPTAQGPTWSPDGAKIAFQLWDEGSDTEDIYVFDTNGENLQRLTQGPGSNMEPAWSPDGAKIAFSSTRNGNPEIYVMNADGSGQTRLTNNLAADRAPAWQTLPTPTSTATPTSTSTATPTSTPTPTPTPLPCQVSVTAVEVTQGIQNLEGSQGSVRVGTLPLVAGKDTVVRVYARTAGGDVCEQVEGRLQAFQGEQKLLPTPLLPDNSSMTVRGQEGEFRRSDLDASLNFGWPDESPIPSGEIILEVTLTDPDGLELDNASISATFVERRSLDIVVFPVQVGYQTANLVEAIGEIRPYLEDTYPVPEVNISLRFGEWLQIPFLEGTLDNRLLNWMALQKRTQGHGDTLDHFLGIIPSEAAWGSNGLGSQCWKWGLDPKTGNELSVSEVYACSGGYVALVQEGGGIVGPGHIAAHEVGHNLGRQHVDCPELQSEQPDNIDPDWPRQDPGGDDDCRIADAASPLASRGYDVHGSTLNEGFPCFATPFRAPLCEALGGPTDWVDFMSYAFWRWVSDYTYEKLFDLFAPQGEGAAALMGILGPVEVLAVGGLVDPVGGTGGLDAAYRLSQPLELPLEAAGDYTIELRDAGDQTLASRSFGVATGEALGGYFLEVVPASPQVAKIVLVRGETELDSLDVSAAAPSVQLLYPNGGESLNGPFTVSWDGEDPDADPLSYLVEYSADGGGTWSLIASGLSDSHLDVDTSVVSGTSAGRFRITASDGVLSTSDTSDGDFSVASHPPEAAIVHPSGGETIPEGWPFGLQGFAIDLEDGTLAGAALSWSSDISGLLGTGQSLIVEDLPAGAHTITLAATDFDTNTAFASVAVEIVPDDGDPLPAGYEISRYCLDLSSNDAATDPDGDGLSNLEEYNLSTEPCHPDTDADGCTDGQELGPDEMVGGQRDPLSPWDFFDPVGAGGQPPDQYIDLFNDILGVIERYTAGGGVYDPAFDRGPSTGPNLWDMTAPDGNIDLFNDILGVVSQYQHDCR